MYTVYVATNLKNGKRYIGVTGSGLAHRKHKHLTRAKAGDKGCPRFYAAIRKYGEANFKWDVLAEFSFRALAYHHEFVAVNDTKPEYNAIRGGNLGPDYNPRKKPVICLESGVVYASTMAAAKSLKISQSNISAACRGIGTTAHGMHFMFFTFPMSTNDRTSAIGDIESRGIEKRRRAVGREIPQATRRQRAGKAVICLDTGEVYKSTADAGRAIGVDAATISRVCRFDRGNTSAKGKHFAFVRDVGQRMMA